MTRFARVVVEGIPHHVTQRGNRRLPTFFSRRDYMGYLDLLREWAPKTGVRVWCYCLMPNHVHLILVPDNPSALGRCLAEVHQRHTRRINQERGWQGYLWQGRFRSFPMDERHTIAAARYVLMNPVRAGLVDTPVQWKYSSARAHLAGRSDGVVDSSGLEALVGDWRSLLTLPATEEGLDPLRRHARTGRPLGDRDFISRLERATGRTLQPQKTGPKPKPRMG
jgi:putative transposase